MRHATRTLLFLALCLAPGAAAGQDCRMTAETPRAVAPAEAQRLYDCIEQEIVAAYTAIEGVPGVPDYRGWQVVSTAPFVSRTHGNMFINHIVSPEALSLYRQWEEMAGRLPTGTIVAKESFLIARDGRPRAGPLFLMEKAPEGEAAATGGWIYTRIFIDGRIERTGGEGDRSVRFCHDCHGAVPHHDAMFFPPRDRRIGPDD